LGHAACHCGFSWPSRFRPPLMVPGDPGTAPTHPRQVARQWCLHRPAACSGSTPGFRLFPSAALVVLAARPRRWRYSGSDCPPLPVRGGVMRSPARPACQPTRPSPACTRFCRRFHCPPDPVLASHGRFHLGAAAGTRALHPPAPQSPAGRHWVLSPPSSLRLPFRRSPLPDSSAARRLFFMRALFQCLVVLRPCVIPFRRGPASARLHARPCGPCAVPATRPPSGAPLALRSDPGFRCPALQPPFHPSCRRLPLPSRLSGACSPSVCWHSVFAAAVPTPCWHSSAGDGAGVGRKPGFAPLLWLSRSPRSPRFARPGCSARRRPPLVVPPASIPTTRTAGSRSRLPVTCPWLSADLSRCFASVVLLAPGLVGCPGHCTFSLPVFLLLR